MSYKWAHLGSNQGPTSYEPAALTTELWARAETIIAYAFPLVKREFLRFRVGMTDATSRIRHANPEPGIYSFTSLQFVL